MTNLPISDVPMNDISHFNHPIRLIRLSKRRDKIQTSLTETRGYTGQREFSSDFPVKILNCYF